MTRIVSTTCSQCGLAKTSYTRPSDGRVEWRCYPCHNEKMRALYASSPERRASVAAARKRRRAIPEKRALESRQFKEAHLRRRFGIGLKDYEALLEKQGGKCAVRSSTNAKAPKGGSAFHVDHCHQTGNIRGLLCFDCNSGIGKLGDNLEGLMRAVRYLEAIENHAAF